jgi:hypothetical protein
MWLDYTRGLLPERPRLLPNVVPPDLLVSSSDAKHEYAAIKKAASETAAVSKSKSLLYAMMTTYLQIYVHFCIILYIDMIEAIKAGYLVKVENPNLTIYQATKKFSERIITVQEEKWFLERERVEDVLGIVAEAQSKELLSDWSLLRLPVRSTEDLEKARQEAAVSDFLISKNCY